MSSALYVFRLFWPFLKELVLGGITLKEGMKTQKKRVFLLFFVSGLIFTIFLIIPKFYQLSQEHTKLEKSVEAANVRRLQERIKELETRPEKTTPATELPVIAESTPEPPKEPLPSPTRPHRSGPVMPKVPEQKAPDKPLPELAAPPPEEKNDRKKAYMDFFDKLEDR